MSDKMREAFANLCKECGPTISFYDFEMGWDAALAEQSEQSAELERLRKDAAKVLNSEQIRIAAVAAVRAVTGCPDIKGKDGAYLVDEIIVRLLEMQNDAAIAGVGWIPVGEIIECDDGQWIALWSDGTPEPGTVLYAPAIAAEGEKE